MIAQADNHMSAVRSRTLTSRVHPRNWRDALFFVVFGIASIILLVGVSPKRHDPTAWAVATGINIPLFLLGFGVALWTLHCQITADETGIVWRRAFSRWRFAAWHEITDYYEWVSPKSRRYFVVETLAGKFRFNGNMTNIEGLRDYVQTHAVATRAKAWGMKGTRPEDDWPQTFTRGRQQQPVVADLKGIEFGDGHRRVKVTWDEVTEYFVASSQGMIRSTGSGHYTVVTSRGTFEFTHLTSQHRLLKAIIRRYACRASADNWQPRHGTHEDVIGGAASCWSGGLEGVGQRIYHYRTRLNRALLWAPTGFALAAVIGMYVSSQLGVGGPDLDPSKQPVDRWPGAVILGLLALWGWWRYYVASICTDKQGITQYSLLGKRSIPWEEVREYYVSGSEEFTFGNVVSDSTRIWFYMTVADVEQLKSEVARCAPPSCTRTWEG